jgi:predicted metal-dependent phosphoesterase TrpH
MNKIKTLIHVHTDYSFDSDVSVESLADFAQRDGIGCIAVTDHDTIDGARHLASVTGATVIVGEEVTTRDGHLIGLFLQERVRPGMDARKTAEAIRAQGGLVLLPHPFVVAFGCGLRHVAWEIADLVDAVEINNAQNLLPGPDRKARRFAQDFGLPTYVGADSHLRSSIAPCYQWMDEFDGHPARFLTALRGAQFEGPILLGAHGLNETQLINSLQGVGGLDKIQVISRFASPDSSGKELDELRAAAKKYGKKNPISTTSIMGWSGFRRRSP